jgi:outer membrane receptor protein involved in Fe transport
MKISLSLWITAGLLTPLAAGAQTPPPPAKNDNNIVLLSAFEVHSTKDEGYRAANAVSTTGIAQELVKTPLPITVVTEQFLKDADLSGFLGALTYISGVALDPNAPDGNNSPANYQGNLNRFRGQPINGTYRNGMKIVYGFATENVDRVEIAKGPMAVFIGGATLGGEVNVITKKPKFFKFDELYFRYGSHDSYTASFDSTGPITKTLAYRLIGSYKDKTTWRDFSHSRTEFLNPQLLWQPLAKFSLRADAVWRDAAGNNVSQNTSSTKNYQADFDAPRQALLDLGKRRTTGASAGLPYTMTDYQKRIGRAFGTWRQDVFDAFGYWDTLGRGEGLTEGNAPDGRRYNYFGPDSGFETNLRVFESEAVLVATDWLQFRVQGRTLRAWQQDDFIWYGSRIYADGSTPIAGFGAQRNLLRNDTARAEMFFTKRLSWFDNKLLVGVEGVTNKNRQTYGTYDYSLLGSIAPSPNVKFAPNPIVNSNQFAYFDPAVQAFPNTKLISRWADEGSAAGAAVRIWKKDYSRAAYLAGSSAVWDNRLVFTGGFRRSRDQTVTSNTDRFDQVTKTSTGALSISSTPRVYTNSWMAGLTFEVVKGVNLYASYTKGETYQSGFLVNRSDIAGSDVPSDIVPLEERQKYPVSNSTGEGKEAGVKFSLFKGKLTGSFGWFNLTRGGVLISDYERTVNDPRNVGTEVDPNPATADTAVRTRVAWIMPVRGNITEGFETDLIWTPIPAYSVIFAASHLYKNELTVDKPASNDPTVLRSWTVLNGRPLPNSPDDTLRIFQRYTVQNGRLKGLSVSVGVRYQSSQMPSSGDVNWGIIFPGYWVEDAIVGYSTTVLNKPVTFQLSCSNVSNKSYFTGNRVWGPPREFGVSTRIQF